MGIEPATCGLRYRCSTIELHQHVRYEILLYYFITDLSEKSTMYIPGNSDDSFIKKLPAHRKLADFWSGRRDSNPRSSAWEADALPLSHTRNVDIL